MTNEQITPSAHIAIDDGDNAYSIYVNDQRALQLNHLRYINQAVQNLRTHPQHRGSYADFTISRDIALRIDTVVWLGIVHSHPIAAEDEPTVQNLFDALIGDTGRDHQDVRSHIGQTTADVDNAWMNTLRAPDDEGGTPSVDLRVKRLSEQYPDGVWIPVFPK